MAARYTGTSAPCQSLAMKTQSSPKRPPLTFRMRGASRAARLRSAKRNCRQDINNHLGLAADVVCMQVGRTHVADACSQYYRCTALEHALQKLGLLALLTCSDHWTRCLALCDFSIFEMFSTHHTAESQRMQSCSQVFT